MKPHAEAALHIAPLTPLTARRLVFARPPAPAGKVVAVDAKPDADGAGDQPAARAGRAQPRSCGSG